MLSHRELGLFFYPFNPKIQTQINMSWHQEQILNSIKGGLRHGIKKQCSNQSINPRAIPQFAQENGRGKGHERSKRSGHRIIHCNGIAGDGVEGNIGGNEEGRRIAK